MIVPLIYCSRNRKDFNRQNYQLVKMMLREGIDLAKKQGKQLLKQ